MNQWMRSSKKPTTHFWSIEIIRVKKVLDTGLLAVEIFIKISKRKGQGN